MKLSFLWLKDYIRTQASAIRVSDDLTMAGLEIKKIQSAGKDTQLENEITTNRPDWLSHIGVARELYAIRGGKFSLPSTKIAKTTKSERRFKVSLKSTKQCPYYSAVLLEGVEWKETPTFMKQRLEVCGIRSINLIVDITNYVLLEFGQPLHAFDADLLSGDVISARRATQGEKMQAIDDEAYELCKDDLVIADKNGAVAIGGVMGGKGSEVSAKTTNILIESAYFSPSTVRSTSRRLGLVSESSYRFERCVDPLGVDKARDRAVHLIQKYATVKSMSGVSKAGKLPVQRTNISFDTSCIKQILGMDIPASKTKAYLKRLGLKVTGAGRRLKVQSPSFRADLTRPIDLVEEVSRLYGFDRIPETIPQMIPHLKQTDGLVGFTEKVRDLCVALGLQETVTFSLVEPKPLEGAGLDQKKWTSLLNPMNKELDLLRPSLLPGFLKVMRSNLNVGETDIRLFEVGKKYLSPGDGAFPHEERVIGFSICGESGANWVEPQKNASFYALKGMVDEFCCQLNLQDCTASESQNAFFAPGKGIALSIGGKEIGQYGQISSDLQRRYDVKREVFFAEFRLLALMNAVKPRAKVKDIPKFPASPRDLTVLLPISVQACAIESEIKSMAGDLVRHIDIFDSFKGDKLGKGKKSLSFRIAYQAVDRTLENEEVNKLHFEIIDSLSAKFQAQLPEG